MKTIPVSQLVKINPGVLAAAGSLAALLGLILTADTAVPVGKPMSFATATDVGNFFGLSSDEYKAAQIYFQGPANATKAASALLFAQYPSAPVAGYLRGAKLSMALDDLKLLTGTLTVTADGVANTSASIDLSTITSYSDAAATIEAAFTTPGFTVTYDATRGAFKFTSSTTGASSSVGYATTGTLATALKLTQAAGAVTSQGAAAATPNAYMSALIQQNSEWSLFTTMFEPVLDDKTEFSAWTSLQDNDYAYVGWDSDANALTAGSENTWGAAVKLADYGGSVVLYGDRTHAAFVLGYAASLDFTRRNGRATLAFKGQEGLLPAVDNATDAAALLGNGYNFYGVYGTGSQSFNMLQAGSVSGQYLWLDSYLNQLWLRANLQLALLQLLISVGSVPYNEDGYSLVSSACLDPITAAINFGAIRAGVMLSNSQAQQVNQATGLEVAPIIQSSGYYLQVSPADASTRAARRSPPVTLYYTDGQSIQNISMAAIEIQ